MSLTQSKENDTALNEFNKFDTNSQDFEIAVSVLNQSDEAHRSASNGKAVASPNHVQSNENFGCFSESSMMFEHVNAADGGGFPAPALAFEKKESRDVKRFKIIVMSIVFVVAVVASTCVLVFTNKAEQSQFEAVFQQDALKVFESIRNSIDNTLMPLDNLAVALVSHAKALNATWPFVTLDDFAVRIAKVLPLTDAILIAVLPVVTPENRLQWENYSRTHDQWVIDGIDVQNNWDLYYGPKDFTFLPELSAEISGNDGVLEANIRYESTNFIADCRRQYLTVTPFNPLVE